MTTPSQTVGPYFAIGLRWDEARFVVAPDTPGAVRIAGAVYDGEGAPVPDSLIETWQADDAFRGFGRCGFERDDGAFEIVTRKPRPFGGEAPHLDVSVFARGLLHRVVTRIYFADEPDANASDPVLKTVPAHRRETLLAQPAADGYRFDIHLQGPRETVFFAL